MALALYISQEFVKMMFSILLSLHDAEVTSKLTKDMMVTKLCGRKIEDRRREVERKCMSEM